MTDKGHFDLHGTNCSYTNKSNKHLLVFPSFSDDMLFIREIKVSLVQQTLHMKKLHPHGFLSLVICS